MHKKKSGDRPALRHFFLDNGGGCRVNCLSRMIPNTKKRDGNEMQAEGIMIFFNHPLADFHLDDTLLTGKSNQLDE
jgi:hypothetical protein